MSLLSLPIFDERSDLAEGLLPDSRSLGTLLPEAGEDAEVVEVLAKKGFSDAFSRGLEEEVGCGRRGWSRVSVRIPSCSELRSKDPVDVEGRLEGFGSVSIREP